MAAEPPKVVTITTPASGETAKVYAFGVYKGKKPVQVVLGGNNHEVTQVDIIVTETNHPVVLVLSAYDPVVWRIGQVKNAKVLGVVVGGAEPQAVIGLDKDVPQKTLISQDRHPMAFNVYGERKRAEMEKCGR